MFFDGSIGNIIVGQRALYFPGGAYLF